MRSTTRNHRGLLFGLVVAFGVAALVGGGASESIASPDEAVGPPVLCERGVTLGTHGERALERLPWETLIVRANLAADRPVAVSAAYLMERHLLVVSNTGLVYCLDRRNLEPRWVTSLRSPLARPPAEGPGHYVFLTRGNLGSHWLEVISKRSGTPPDRFPVRLPFATPPGAGIAANASIAFVPSLGRPGNNKLLESVNLISGRMAWGYRASGMIFGSIDITPDGEVLVFGADDGSLVALPASAAPPRREIWRRQIAGAVLGGVRLTPESVLVGTQEGLVYNVDVLGGDVRWMRGVDAPVREQPWVIGRVATVTRETGIEGAEAVEVRQFVGTAFVRNRLGLHAFDLATGTPLFRAPNVSSRPLARHGKWVATVDRNRRVTFRNAEEEYAVQGRLDLGVFALVPTNTLDGAIYGCTADGTVVAAIPR